MTLQLGNLRRGLPSVSAQPAASGPLARGEFASGTVEGLEAARDRLRGPGAVGVVRELLGRVTVE